LTTFIKHVSASLKLSCRCVLRTSCMYAINGLNILCNKYILCFSRTTVHLVYTCILLYFIWESFKRNVLAFCYMDCYYYCSSDFNSSVGL